MRRGVTRSDQQKPHLMLFMSFFPCWRFAKPDIAYQRRLSGLGQVRYLSLPSSQIKNSPLFIVAQLFCFRDLLFSFQYLDPFGSFGSSIWFMCYVVSFISCVATASILMFPMVVIGLHSSSTPSGVLVSRLSDFLASSARCQEQVLLIYDCVVVPIKLNQSRHSINTTGLANFDGPLYPLNNNI